ncbi:MAG TPA: hypothetical protein VMS64_05945 [Candidatus Methylomirabilis sp.]|nr:hypothetical protein [Candidatus Methylomirabilis sp.]
MILHVNHTAPGGQMVQHASELVGALLSLVEEGRVDASLLPTLHVHLDWIQYRGNFREPVTLRRAANGRGEPMPLAEVAVDLRQVETGRLRDTLARALEALGPSPEDDRRVLLDDFVPIRESLIWQFNRLFWQRLGEWERASGRGFEEALPSGRSDANHPQAVADSVGDFWTLLRDMEKRGQLPPEIFALEIGVGSGIRAALWLDRFRALDEERGTGYYPRLRFLLGDYSLPTLDRAMAAVQRHQDVVSVLALDALNPFRTLSFLRYKILYVHLTNVYDNLPHDELVRRDGRLYLVEARTYLAVDAARRIAEDFGLTVPDLPRLVARLLEVGPEVIGDKSRGVAFWRAVWDALRLEERLIALDDFSQVPLPSGLDQSHLEDLLGEAPEDVRFHLSRGAAESFINTLPLLHPRGYLQVQDIFVTAMDGYRQGFRGPGKLDGSVVSWVNGALLRAVGARAGYDVHFAPFRYRPGSRTSILYTTQRD